MCTQAYKYKTAVIQQLINTRCSTFDKTVAVKARERVFYSVTIHSANINSVSHCLIQRVATKPN